MGLRAGGLSGLSLVQVEIAALQNQELARNARQQEATERRNREAELQPASFTGYLTTVEIEGL